MECGIITLWVPVWAMLKGCQEVSDMIKGD